METLPNALRRYLTVVVLGALAALTVALVCDTARFVTLPIPTLVVLVVGTLLASLHPVHLTTKTKVTADSAFLVAAALLVGPAMAMVIAALGVGAAQFWRRVSWAEVAFNPAQAMLWVGAGSLLSRLSGNSASGTAGRVGGVLLALVLMHALNTLLVALAGAWQTGSPPLAFWRDGLGADLREQLILAASGVLLAVGMTHHALLPLVAVLSLVPVVVRRLGHRVPHAALDPMVPSITGGD